jgi:hypothetical protein
MDASSFGMGGVVLGELLGKPPTVFWSQWPQDMTKNMVSFQNPHGALSI